MSHAFGDVGKYGDAFRQVGSNTGQLVSVEDGFDRFTEIPRMSAVPVAG